MILGQLNLLNLKARLIIFSQPIIAAIRITMDFPYVIAEDPLQDAMLNFTDGSSSGRASYIIANGKK